MSISLPSASCSAVSEFGKWEFPETNASQAYATHNYIRYFGKLPPVVLRRIIEHGLRDAEGGPFLDIMCGSGTSLVEGMLLGYPGVGVDINPLSVLASQVKTTPVEPELLLRTLERLLSDCSRDLDRLRPHARPTLFDSGEGPERTYWEPEFANKDYWFTRPMAQQLSSLRHHIDAIEDPDLRNFYKLTFLSIVRRASNASARAGRLFKECDRDIEVLALFSRKARENIRGMETFLPYIKTPEVRLYVGDARQTCFEGERYPLVIFHPPYFALYRYSADILRFELEWGGFDRSQIARGEIADGYKTTRRSDFDRHIADLGAVCREAARLLRPAGRLCVITNNSTFRDEVLPVTDRLIEEAAKVGLPLEEGIERQVRFAQASYHRSERADKQTNADYIMFFRKL